MADNEMKAKCRPQQSVRLSDELASAVSSLKCNTLYQWRESGNTWCFLYPARRGCNMGYHHLSQEERYIVALWLLPLDLIVATMYRSSWERW